MLDSIKITQRNQLNGSPTLGKQLDLYQAYLAQLKFIQDGKINKRKKTLLNYREFYYIQMEKFARDADADDKIQCKEDIVVSVRQSGREEKIYFFQPL